MPSELFRDLLRQAREREARLWQEVNNVWLVLAELTDNQDRFDMPWSRRLADAALLAYEEFLDDLAPIARRMGRDIRANVCPCCGDPDCQGAQMGGMGGAAVHVASVPGAVHISGPLSEVLKQLLQGKINPPGHGGPD